MKEKVDFVLGIWRSVRGGLERFYCSEKKRTLHCSLLNCFNCPAATGSAKRELWVSKIL